jgi:hypothetical protein
MTETLYDKTKTQVYKTKTKTWIFVLEEPRDQDLPTKVSFTNNFIGVSTKPYLDRF